MIQLLAKFAFDFSVLDYSFVFANNLALLICITCLCPLKVKKDMLSVAAK